MNQPHANIEMQFDMIVCQSSYTTQLLIECSFEKKETYQIPLITEVLQLSLQKFVVHSLQIL
jgi:hypothetical protein